MQQREAESQVVDDCTAGMLPVNLVVPRLLARDDITAPAGQTGPYVTRLLQHHLFW